jgi:hypothetical protein
VARLLATLGVVAAASGGVAAAGPTRAIETNRAWEVLDPPTRTSGPRGQLLAAAAALGDVRIELAGASLDGDRLAAIARATPDQRLVAGLRDALGLPVDADDLLLFLDDVLRARAGAGGDPPVFVTAGRARTHGILLHPDDVFGDRPRRYGSRGALPIDRPVPQRDDLPPAADGDPPGPGWAMRYRNPLGEAERLAALTRRTGDPGLERRVRLLVDQLRAQGAEVSVSSTVRRPERGYLMWGAFLLSRTESASDLDRTVDRLDRANRDWGLDVPITWRPPVGWRAVREAAREMADTYEVVFATEQGARRSRHYGGRAVDLVAVDLPRRLVLEAPDGAVRAFDLSGVDEPLDLSLTPEVIDWIEAHFGLRKLRSDHPHWDDAGG